MANLVDLISNRKVIEIQKFANGFAKLINKDIVVKCGLFNQSDIYTKTVYLGLARYTKQQEADVLFSSLDMVESGFDYLEYCTHQTFSFFHEIGHIIMAQFYGSKLFEHKRYTLQVNSIVEMWEMGEITTMQKNQFYNKIPMENDANSWALLFIKQNQQLVKVYETVMNGLIKDLFPNG